MFTLVETKFLIAELLLIALIVLQRGLKCSIPQQSAIIAVVTTSPILLRRVRRLNFDDGE